MENPKGLVVPIVLAIIAIFVLGGTYYVYTKRVAIPAHNTEYATTPTTSTSPTTFDILADWKNYRNEEYWFEFKYPTSFRFEDNLTSEKVSDPQNTDLKWYAASKKESSNRTFRWNVVFESKDHSTDKRWLGDSRFYCYLDLCPNAPNNFTIMVTPFYVQAGTSIEKAISTIFEINDTKISSIRKISIDNANGIVSSARSEYRIEDNYYILSDSGILLRFLVWKPTDLEGKDYSEDERGESKKTQKLVDEAVNGMVQSLSFLK